MARYSPNPFYVHPGGDMSEGLAGLGQVIRENRAAKEAKARAEAEAQRQAEARQAAIDAVRSGDPMRVAEVSLQYPDLSENIANQTGMIDKRRREEGFQYMAGFINAPDDAQREALVMQRAEALRNQGRDPSHTLQSWQDYQASPEKELKAMNVLAAMQYPDRYKAMQEAMRVDAPEIREFKEGDRIVTKQFDPTTGSWNPVADAARFNPKAGVSIDFGGMMGGAPELGKLSTDYGYVLDPATGKPVINPETGLPMAAPVPGSKASREISQAEDKAGMQGDLADITSDTIIESAMNARELISKFTTGAGGTLMSNIPWSDASDLFRYTDSLKATAAAENINKMRQASPTGGALGNASDADIKLLKDKAGALDPRSERYPEQLDDYVKTLLRVVNGKEAGDEIYNTQWLGQNPVTQDAQSEESANAGVPDGVDPELWEFMTPEQKALWK